MKNKKLKQLIATAMITTTLSATLPTAINPTIAFASETVYNTEQDAANAGFIVSSINDGTEYEISGYTGTNTDVTIPSRINGKSVTSIGYFAFAEASNLTTITIPNSVTSIGYAAFAHCSGLTSITIPNSVTSIGDYAFYDCSGLTSIVIPEGVTSIGESIFAECSRLTSIIIPSSVTNIGDSAFSRCINLTSITIPNSVTSIGNYAFVGCTALTSITIPESVTSIGYNAFNGCSDLKSIVIPESVTNIGDYSFNNINNDAIFYVDSQRLANLLQSFKIGNIKIIVGNQNQAYTVTYNGNENEGGTAPIDSGNYEANAEATVLDNTGDLVKTGYTFVGWNTEADGSGINYAAGSSLTIGDSNVTLYAKWTRNQEIDPGFTYELINNDTEYKITGYTGTNTDVTIPSKINGKNVTSIGNRAFDGRNDLTSITIPEGVTSIGDFAFNYCSGLTSITIPNSVTSIGDYAFYVCASLTSITIPNNVTSIGDSAFMYCGSLMSITIPDSVTSINNSAFDYINDYSIFHVDSERLAGLLQPYKVGNIKIIVGNQTYTVTYDGNGSEGGSVPTDSGSYADNATATVLDNTSLVKDGYTFAGWNTEADGSGTDYPAGSSLAISDSNVTLYAKWTKNQDIDPGFQYRLINNDTEYEITGYTGISTDITIPSQIDGKNVTGIGIAAFYNYRNLNSITIPEGVTSIGHAAFYYCTNLKSVTIPESVTSIGESVFYNCFSLTSITIPENVTSIGSNAFSNINDHAVFYVDSQRLANLLQSYKVGNIQIIVANQNQTYTVTYYGNESSEGSVPTDSGNYEANAEAIVLDNIGSLKRTGYTFAGWNTEADGSGTDYLAGSSLTISDSNITLYAKWTKNQDIDPGLTYQLINNDTEYSITGYTGTSTDITIPSQINGKNVTAIGDDAFNSHENLKSIIIPDSVTSIGGYAFINCVSLKSITIPDSITSIGFAAFYNCASLTSLTIPNSVTNIEAYAFGDCSNLTLITIPDSVTTIDHNAFYAINNNAIFYVDSQRLANLLQPYKIGNIKIIVGNQNETYTVTYDGNGSTGGTVPTDSGSYAGDATATVLENTGNLVKDGYTFVGWNTEADGSGIDYSDGSSLAISDSNVTLYAKWTKNQDIDPGFEYRLINNDTEYEITGYSGTNTDITIPSQINGKNVTSIGNNAFNGKIDVTSIIIPDTVTSIGDYAFYYCSSLRSIKIPNGVTSIGAQVFYNCTALTSITIPDTVTSIGDYAFLNCSSLTSIKIPKGVTSIGIVAFYNCSSLTSIEIPDNVTNIGFVAFANINDHAIFYVDSQRLANLLQSYKVGNIQIIVRNQTYTVTYAGNGNTEGTVPTDSGNYETNVAATVLDNTGNLKRAGYTFAGWNTAEDGSGIDYAAGSSLTIGSGNVTLYAKWTRNQTYTVTYAGNGNTEGTVPTDSGNYEANTEATVLGNTDLVKPGYTFVGWNTEADGSGTDYVAGSSLTIGSGNVTLYAKWTRNQTYTVTYAGNGNTEGTVPTDSGNYEANTEATVLGNTDLVKPGYTFAGWNTEADGSGTDYAAGSSLTIGSGNVTLYAKWTRNQTYTVTYAGNGSTGGTAPTDSGNYEANTEATVLGNTDLVKPGYTFAGWNTEADGSGTDYAAGSSLTIGSGNVTLYAKWTRNQTYTVTYAGNGSTGGTAPTDSGNYEANTEATVLGNTDLVKPGYTFAGWNTEADGSGTDYAAGSSLTIGSGNVTLYAKWTKNQTYTVTYAGNGNTEGTVPTDSGNYETNVAATVLDNTGNLKRAGYTFAGWNTAEDGSGIDYVAGSSLTIGSGNVTLYAKWTRNQTYTVTYNGNGNTEGTVPTDSGNYEANAEATVLGNTDLVKPGYTFVGWNTEADGSGTDYAAGSSLTIGSGNVTLYAKWTRNQTYTVTYNGNGNTEGTVPTDSGNYEANAEVTVLGNTDLVKPGYTFAGWNTEADGSGTDYAAGSSLTIDSGNVTLYAKWTRNQTYTVTYNGNGNTEGTVPTDSGNYEANAEATVLGNTNLVKPGYTFAGWNTAEDGSGIDYASGSSLTIDSGNVTLYAKWTRNEEISVVNVHSIDNITVENGTSISDIDLPETATIELSDGTTTSAAVTWNDGNPEYDGDTEGTYVFTGTLTLPDGVTNSSNLKAIMSVNVKAAENETPPSAVTVESIESLDNITVDNGTEIGDIELPDTIDVNLSDSTTTSAAVTWDNGDPKYDGNKAGTYLFKGILRLLDGITNPSNLKASVVVNVRPAKNETTPAAVTVESVESLDNITVNNGTARKDIKLPDTVRVTLNDSTTTSANIRWEDVNPIYNGYRAGTYVFTGKLILPEGVTNPYDYSTKVNVIVKAASSSSSSSSHHHNSSTDTTSTSVTDTTSTPTNNTTNNENTNTNTNADIKGWSQDTSGNWYLEKDNGDKTKGWKLVDSKWYFFDNNTGAMKTGWYKSETGDWKYDGQDTQGQWFHLGSDGKLTTGWLKDTDNNWYYLCDGSRYGALGVMKTGWQHIDGSWYYFNSNGTMASNTVVDGYELGNNGALI